MNRERYGKGELTPRVCVAGVTWIWYSDFMKESVSHDRSEETIEAKARWFRSLSLQERMEILCSFTDFALKMNPRLPDLKDAKQAEGRIRILSKTTRY